MGLWKRSVDGLSWKLLVPPNNVFEMNLNFSDWQNAWLHRSGTLMLCNGETPSYQPPLPPQRQSIRSRLAGFERSCRGRLIGWLQSAISWLEG